MIAYQYLLINYDLCGQLMLKNLSKDILEMIHEGKSTRKKHHLRKGIINYHYVLSLYKIDQIFDLIIKRQFIIPYCSFAY